MRVPLDSQKRVDVTNGYENKFTEEFFNITCKNLCVELLQLNDAGNHAVLKIGWTSWHYGFNGVRLSMNAVENGTPLVRGNLGYRPGALMLKLLPYQKSSGTSGWTIGVNLTGKAVTMRQILQVIFNAQLQHFYYFVPNYGVRENQQIFCGCRDWV